MNKLQPSIIALSCIMALSACSSSSKGGTDNSEQIRQTEIELNQKIAEANKKAEAAVKKAEEAAKANSQKTEAEKNAAQEALKKAEEAAKAALANNQKTEAEKNAAQEAQKEAEKRLKQLETLQANEKSRIPLSDQIFGGASGEMTETISGGTLVGKQNSPARLLTRDIRDLAIIDENGRIVDINILRRAGGIDEWGDEVYDPYNLRKDGQTILSNDNFKSSAFGTYVDNLTGNQYFFAQGLPTAVAQIPTTGIAEYKGGAVYKKDNANSERSEMKASADFANKVIDINIMKKTNAVPEMHFGGKITANSFAGEVNGIKTQGGFFGENAREMTGLFTNEADKSRGAFGGIKQ